MAIVPFRVSGPAASQESEQRFLQIGPYSLLLKQRPQDSGNVDHLYDMQQTVGNATDLFQQPSQRTTPSTAAAAAAGPDLSRVGLVLWQSGYVLADFLLLRLPHLQSGHCSSWAGMSVLELGCGAGTVGLFLALAGAKVVLTDQAHILPLTHCNVEMNFPATSTNIYSNSKGGSSAIDSCHKANPRSFNSNQQTEPLGQRSEPAQKQPDLGLSHSTPAHAPTSAVAAFAAAFSPAQHHDAAAAQLQTQSSAAAQLCNAVFGSGPLVVEYTWGELWDQLQKRVCSAADARLTNTNQAEQQQLQQHAFTERGDDDDDDNDDDATQPAPGICSSAPQQLGSNHPQSRQLDCCFDVVVGADLLYDPSYHAALLQSLDCTCSPHTQVYMCYRLRGLGEDMFQETAAAAGWAVQTAPSYLLHPEYQGGEYRMLFMTKI